MEKTSSDVSSCVQMLPKDAEFSWWAKPDQISHFMLWWTKPPGMNWTIDEILKTNMLLSWVCLKSHTAHNWFSHSRILSFQCEIRVVRITNRVHRESSLTAFNWSTLHLVNIFNACEVTSQLIGKHRMKCFPNLHSTFFISPRAPKTYVRYNYEFHRWPP